MATISRWLTGITMYRLMLYSLLVLLVVSVLLAAIGILPYDPQAIVWQTLVLTVVALITNTVFARLLKITPNKESVYISALILSFIIGPVAPGSSIVFLAAAASLAMASKYLLTWQKKHIFNPAALAVVATALLMGRGASWWVGTQALVPFTLVLGLIILAKIRRSEMVGSFVATLFCLTLLTSLFHNQSFFEQLPLIIIHSPLVFFATVMLVEPLTTPPRRSGKIAYGIGVAVILVAAQQFVPSISYSLELSLLVANVFAAMVLPSHRYQLTLINQQPLTQDTVSFLFKPLKPLSFIAGQFVELTLNHLHSDSRGIRRYFTVASAPTEKNIMITTKFAQKSSTFKQALKLMKSGDTINVSTIDGDFILPKRSNERIVFIAGGIGITPFRSMIKYLLDTKTKLPITLIYGAHTRNDFVFTDLFNRAKNELGMRVLYVTSQIDAQLIQNKISNYKNARYYISGPEPMVQAIKNILRSIGIARSAIKTDFFPGYEK